MLLFVQRCKYNQFYRLQGKNRQNCVKEGAIFFSTCQKVDHFLWAQWGTFAPLSEPLRPRGKSAGTHFQNWG